MPAYLGMSYLYKRANWLWPILIRHKLVATVWRPLVELTRRRHLKFREELERRASPAAADAYPSALSVMSAGV